MHDEGFDVFISSASTDRHTARSLASHLENHGVRAWFDEAQIKPGDSLRKELERAIDSASSCVVLLGEKTASHRPEVSAEWQAIQKKLWKSRDFQVLPIEIGQHSELPPFLRTSQAIPSGSTEQDMAALADRLADLIRRAYHRQPGSTSESSEVRATRFKQLFEEIQEDIDAEGADPSDPQAAKELDLDFDVEIG